jgi:hypothetical protein
MDELEHMLACISRSRNNQGKRTKTKRICLLLEEEEELERIKKGSIPDDEIRQVARAFTTGTIATLRFGGKERQPNTES